MIGIFVGVLTHLFADDALAAVLSDAFQGAGQEVFTACILGFAVVMLTWHVAWMSRHAREITAEPQRVGTLVRLGQRSLAARAVVVAVAMLREGPEVVLFRFGIMATWERSRSSTIATRCSIAAPISGAQNRADDGVRRAALAA